MPGAVIDLTPFSNLGNNPTALFNAISSAFFYGQMPAAVQTAMQSATSPRQTPTGIQGEGSKVAFGPWTSPISPMECGFVSSLSF